MDSNLYNGVRAEPKFLRDPTSLESISSGISRLSSYVTSNLPKRKPNMTSPFDPQYQQYLQQQQQQILTAEDVLEEDNMEDFDTITFASFDKLEYRGSTLSCLLLGYHDGFQLWDITNPDNVHELCSIRDKDLFGSVSFIHIIKQVEKKPSLAIISEITIKDTTTTTVTTNTNTNTDIPPHQHHRMDSNSSTSTTTIKKSSHLIIYSLQSQSIIKEINDFGGDEEDDTTVVTCIKSNHKVIVLGCLSRHKSSIHLLSTIDFKPFASPLTDIYHDSNGNGPVFTLGSRLIAYATNTAVLNSDPIMASLTNKSISYTGFGVLQGEKDVKGAAKDIAKEVVSGMKTLGEFGYNRLSNYFGNNNNNNQSSQQNDKLYGSSPSSNNNNRRTSNMGHSPRQQQEIYTSTPSSTTSTTNNIGNNTANNTSVAATNKKMMPSGMIMIRDILKLSTTPTRNLSISTMAHFRPHTHPVTCLTFNQAGTLLMSASKQGHTFHIFSILTNTSVTGNASHLYSLSRGITDAQVEDCQFSVDSTWCAISTARGTTHVYAINPYGGKPEISGHVHGKVNNPTYHPFINKSKTKATTLYSVVRIKQRRKMPGNLDSSQDDLGKFSTAATTGNNNTFGYYGPTPPHYISAMPSIMPRTTITNKEPRAKITSMFVTATKSPYLVNNSSVYNNNKGTTASSLSESSTSSPNYHHHATTPLVGSIKQQATSMLSSFGSSMSHLSYLPSAQQTHQKGNYSNNKWNQTADKSDTLMFGFDEEYDDSAKMINDEIGYQDLYSFHPDGILTLHRCWVAKTVVKKRENGRNLEKLDLSLREEDVAEWRVARNADWDQVKLSLDPVTTTTNIEEESSSPPSSTDTPSSPQSKKKKKPQVKQLPPPTNMIYKPTKKLWLSNAEITTYASVPDDPALWTHHQFSFQTYKENKDLQRLLNAGTIPSTDNMIMLKGMPEPVSSRIDRVRKTTTRIANDNVEENMEDALAELEDNISKAMQTSFSPSSNSISNSPAAASLKWLSSSANRGGPSPSPSSVNNKSFLDKISSVSFEDAYLIHMGSGPSPEPSMHNNTIMQHSSLIQFDDDEDDNKMVQQGDEEDIIRLEEDDQDDDMSSDTSSLQQQKDVYSPDGDNEVAYPSESVFGEIRDRNQKIDDDDNDHW